MLQSEILSSMKIEPFTDERFVKIFDDVDSKDQLLSCCAEMFSSPNLPVAQEELLRAFQERERLQPTVEKQGVAFPHALVDTTIPSQVGIVKLHKALLFDEERKISADLFFILVGSKGAAWEHFRILARLGRLSHLRLFIDKMRQASSEAELLSTLRDEDTQHV